MIGEHFILTYMALLVILEYMDLMSSMTDTNMYSIVTIPYIYVSNGCEWHNVFTQLMILTVSQQDLHCTVLYSSVGVSGHGRNRVEKC
jgi:hypothetical protein